MGAKKFYVRKWGREIVGHKSVAKKSKRVQKFKVKNSVQDG